MSTDHLYYVYTLASRSRTLYTSITNHLERRVIQHRQGLLPGFTSKYEIHCLVHFEIFANVRDAIRREKEIKGWRREKKVRLIEEQNPTWQDLSESFAPGFGGQKQIPHPPRRVRDDNPSGATAGGQVES